MPPLTVAALHEQIAAGKTDPLYLLVGADDTEKSAAASAFADMVDEGLQAFNVDRLHGGEITVNDVIDASATFPMMASRRVVIILDAEKLLVPKRESEAADRDMERLAAFLTDPPDHATVVFVCGAVDLRRRIFKLLVKQAHVVNCGIIVDAAGAERWVRTRAAAVGASLDAGAVRMLVERAGLDIVSLRAGLDRVSLYAMGQPVITAEDVLQAVTAAPEAQENFGIANAIGRNDAAGALRELGLALDAGARPEFVLGQVRYAAEKLPGPRLRDAIDAVFRTDLAIKSSAGDPRSLLERLVVELCEPRRPNPTQADGRPSAGSRRP